MTDKKQKTQSKNRDLWLVLVPFILLGLAALNGFAFVPHSFHSRYINLDMPAGTPGYQRLSLYSGAVVGHVIITAQMTYMALYEKAFLDTETYRAPLSYGLFVLPETPDAAASGNMHIYIDWDADDFAESTAWPAKHPVLLLSQSKGQDFLRTDSEQGWNVLRALDTNADGRIDQRDRDFARLGIARPYTAADRKISGPESLSLTSDYIDLSVPPVKLPPIEGDIRKDSYVEIVAADGKRTPLFLVYPEIDKINTRYGGRYRLDRDVLFLPSLRGYGTLPDLHVAMSKDPLLKSQVTAFKACDMRDVLLHPENANTQMQAILFRWAKVEDIAPRSRGPFIDARALAFLEKMLNTKFFQLKKWSNPRAYAALDLTQAFNLSLRHMTAHVLAQTCGAKLFQAPPVYNVRVGDVAYGDINQAAIADMAQRLKGQTERQIFGINLRNFLATIDSAMPPMNRLFLSSY